MAWNDTVSKAFSRAKEIGQFTPKNGIGAGNGITMINLGGRIDKKNYEIRFRNWWRAMPYGFRYNPRIENDPSLLFWLPLSPQNISVKTSFATNIITTMYGTVEEHSEVRYHDIVISGTTGITPKYSQIFKGAHPALDDHGRGSYVENKADFFDQSGVFKRAKAAFDNIRDQASDLFAGDKEIATGVSRALTGHAAFHNFFRFLLEYKRDTSGIDVQDERVRHPLQFLNYKDNIEYDCVMQDFSWTKSASDPFLYNYSITMRCYNLRTLNQDEQRATLLITQRDLGLDGVKGSVFADVANKARNAKNIVHQVIAAGGGI